MEGACFLSEPRAASRERGLAEIHVSLGVSTAVTLHFPLSAGLLCAQPTLPSRTCRVHFRLLALWLELIPQLTNWSRLLSI